MQSDISIWWAFGAGALSFVSPCTLPLFPSYLGYISGVAFQKSAAHPEVISGSQRWKAFTHALCFCLGLSVLFILLGSTATAFGSVLAQYKDTVRVVGGVFILVMGLFMAGVIRSDWLLKERKFHMPAVKPLGYLGSVLVGIVFAAGWTPCIGPILSSVLIMVIENPGVGDWYMLAYALGFSIPFLVLAVTLVSIRPLLRYTTVIARVGGILLAVMGLLLITDKMTLITIWVQKTTGFSGF